MQPCWGGTAAWTEFPGTCSSVSSAPATVMTRPWRLTRPAGHLVASDVSGGTRRRSLASPERHGPWQRPGARAELTPRSQMA